MIRTSPRTVAAALAVLALGACATAQSPAETGVPSGSAPVGASAPGAPGGSTASQADIHFMTGMIPHHAQAVIMAKWAPTHGAREDVRILAERIVVAQADEIALVRSWLREVGAPVPPSNATHVTMNMNGMTHDMVMPGMLTDAEMAQLDKARGSEFDRLFLTFMIRHHLGAITMVDQLFASYAGGLDETVFRFASDVYADQTTEIDRMQKMLETVPPGAP
jgi:uncharacterized protein (DUF305 family)